MEKGKEISNYSPEAGKNYNPIAGKANYIYSGNAASVNLHIETFYMPPGSTNYDIPGLWCVQCIDNFKYFLSEEDARRFEQTLKMVNVENMREKMSEKDSKCAEQKQSRLFVELTSAQKGRYIRAAQREKMKLNHWVIKHLDDIIDGDKDGNR